MGEVSGDRHSKGFVHFVLLPEEVAHQEQPLVVLQQPTCLATMTGALLGIGTEHDTCIMFTLACIFSCKKVVDSTANQVTKLTPEIRKDHGCCNMQPPENLSLLDSAASQLTGPLGNKLHYQKSILQLSDGCLTEMNKIPQCFCIRCNINWTVFVHEIFITVVHPDDNFHFVLLESKSKQALT